MIVCPNCEHINPDEAIQCEACYTPLPRMSICPQCGASVQADATFCGQCGYSLSGSLPPLTKAESAPIEPISPPSEPPAPAEPAIAGIEMTRLQLETASFLHVQTDRKVELPTHLSIVHIGKPNDRVPPDLDVSGFPDSDIASRIHADVRVEGGIYYIEDTGSANGTYINHIPLPTGNRHRLRSGDRVSLGKGDKLTFIFQLAGQ